MTTKDEIETEEEELAKGIAFFWRSSNLEPHIRSVGLSHGVSKISLGTLHTLLLTFSSELYSVGDNSFGQLGLGDLKSRKEPTLIDYFRDKPVQEIACGGQHSGVICANDDVYFWGDSSSGQCGIGDEKFTCKPTKIQFNHVAESNATSLLPTPDQRSTKGPVIKQLACGDSHTLALSKKGQVWSWGAGCQLGHGIETEKVSFPRQIESLSGKNVIAVVCGAYHSLALVEDSSFPTYMFHRSENVTSDAHEKEQRGRLSKKQKKVSKESLKKGKKLGKNQKARSVSSQQSKSETLLVSSRKGQSCVSRTYLRYGNVPSIGNMQSSLESEKVKGILTGVTEKGDGDLTDAMLLVDHESSENLDHGPSQPQPILASNFKNRDNSLAICDSHYSSPEQTIIDKSFDNRSRQMSTSQARYSLSCPKAGFVTADTGEDYALYESISPGSPLSPASDRSMTFFTSTDFESDESLTKQELKKPQADRIHSDSFYSGISSRLIRTDVNLGKLTSVVVGSVAGMFASAVPGQFYPDNSQKPVAGKSPCEKCGLLGLCLCDNEDVVNKVRCTPVGANTQVWTWGRGGCGQLGLGDTEDRSLPCCVKELSDVGVIKITAGTFHSLAQTIYSQVFSWGDNSCGQLGHKRTIGLYPRKVKCFSEVLIWDIAAGSHYSLFVGDMAVNKPDVYVCGRQPSAMPSVATTMSNIRESRSLPSLAIDESSAPAVTQKKEKRMLIPSRSFDDTKERSLQHCRVEIVRLAMFREVGLVRSLMANTERCACLASSDKNDGQFQAISQLASEERLFYYQLALIWQAVLVPLLQSEVWSCLALQETGEVLAPVIKSFYGVMKCVSSNLVAVMELVESNRSFHDLFEQCLSSEFFQVLESYSENFSNGVAFGVFAAFSSISSDLASQSRAVVCNIMDTAAQDFLGLDNAFQYMMQVPLLKLQHYLDIARKLQSVVSEKNMVDLLRFQEAAELWQQLIARNESRQVDAERTQKFWQESGSRITETFKDCRRRLVRSSNMYSLFPSKSTRFSSHLFLLFDDYFVHSQSQKHFQAHSLATLWADGMDDSEGVLNGIKITTPEEILLLCTPSPADKADWLVAINRAVANVISKTTTYRYWPEMTHPPLPKPFAEVLVLIDRGFPYMAGGYFIGVILLSFWVNVHYSLGIEAVNVNTGSLVPGAAREASYTYQSDNRYIGATYLGMWLYGKPHGHGEMHWPDGRHYTGEFKNGLQHGEGVMIFPPNTAAHSGERYDGQWEDGKMSGHGKMRYSNGGTYEGHWCNGIRSGHGSMQCGGLSSSGASVYIGEWSSDKKCGYGVMDDILRGEKYMGVWDGDSRHGPGLLVTLDGVYNQGTFVQNKLVGNGVLLCDDNTRFEGEFLADCQLGGKGVLTMPNGDFIDGTFTGHWGDGIRVNGVFHKLEPTGTTNSPASSTTASSKYLIPPEKKWMSLFSECRRALGCHGDRDAAPETVLKCMSMSLMSSRDDQQELMHELLNAKDTSNQCDMETLQAYLSKAFDTKHHPLGQLVNGLIDVFRASYVGMGTHRRLLQHAVAEAKSFVIRVYGLVRLIFPDLLNEEYVHVDKSMAVSGVSGHSTEESSTSSALLHPLLFPRLYPPLFTLYALDNERADSAYWERIQQLNKRSDWALMTYVGMKRHFWLTNEHEVGSRSDEVKLENREPKHYITAIDSLQQISTKFSPMEKLKVLKTTFEKINEEVASFWQGEIKLVSLDDLFPVFQFVVIRARIPHLGSEIHFIDDMVDSHVHIGEQGHMFTTLKACFFQIQNEKG